MWINGTIVEKGPFVMDVWDLGILRGYAVFDYLRTFNKKPFIVDRYIERFLLSCDKAGIGMPFSSMDIKNAILQMIDIVNEECAVRMLATGGTYRGYNEQGNTNLIITIEELPETPEHYATTGIVLFPITYRRDMPEIKTVNYFFPYMKKELLIQNRADDFLYVYEGKVLETSRSNIFFVFGDGSIRTPGSGILMGNTRAIVIEILRKNGFSVREGDVHMNDVEASEEAFVTGSSRLVVPVAEITGIKKYSNGAPLTRKVMRLFDDYVKSMVWWHD